MGNKTPLRWCSRVFGVGLKTGLGFARSSQNRGLVAGGTLQKTPLHSAKVSCKIHKLFARAKAKTLVVAG